jgi:hypothetical protein
VYGEKTGPRINVWTEEKNVNKITEESYVMIMLTVRTLCHPVLSAITIRLKYSKRV